MKRIGTDLLKKSKASHKDNRSSGRKDIISVLVQANILEDIPGRMPDEDVLDRVYKLILNQSLYLTPTYSKLQRSPLSLSLVTKQQGTHICTSIVRS